MFDGLKTREADRFDPPLRILHRALLSLGQKEIPRDTFEANTASMQDWSFYGNDLPQSDNHRSNAIERAGQTLRVEIGRAKIDQTIEGSEWETRYAPRKESGLTGRSAGMHKGRLRFEKACATVPKIVPSGGSDSLVSVSMVKAEFPMNTRESCCLYSAKMLILRSS